MRDFIASALIGLLLVGVPLRLSDEATSQPEGGDAQTECPGASPGAPKRGATEQGRPAQRRALATSHDADPARSDTTRSAFNALRSSLPEYVWSHGGALPTPWPPQLREENSRGTLERVLEDAVSSCGLEPHVVALDCSEFPCMLVTDLRGGKLRDCEGIPGISRSFEQLGEVNGERVGLAAAYFYPLEHPRSEATEQHARRERVRYDRAWDRHLEERGLTP